MDRYLLQAFDAKGNGLDISNTEFGDLLYVDGVAELLNMIRRTRSAVLHDFDAETSTRKRIAYFVVSPVIDRRPTEIHVTPWGERCNVTDAAIERNTYYSSGHGATVRPEYVSYIKGDRWVNVA